MPGCVRVVPVEPCLPPCPPPGPSTTDAPAVHDGTFLAAGDLLPLAPAATPPAQAGLSAFRVSAPPADAPAVPPESAPDEPPAPPPAPEAAPPTVTGDAPAHVSVSEAPKSDSPPADEETMELPPSEGAESAGEEPQAQAPLFSPEEASVDAVSAAEADAPEQETPALPPPLHAEAFVFEADAPHAEEVPLPPPVAPDNEEEPAPEEEEPPAPEAAPPEGDGAVTDAPPAETPVPELPPPGLAVDTPEPSGAEAASEAGPEPTPAEAEGATATDAFPQEATPPLAEPVVTLESASPPSTPEAGNDAPPRVPRETIPPQEDDTAEEAPSPETKSEPESGALPLTTLPEPEPAPGIPDAEPGARWRAARARGVLRVALPARDAPPFVYAAGDAPDGFDARLAGAVARRLGLDVEIVRDGFATPQAMAEALVDGRADLAWPGLLPDARAEAPSGLAAAPAYVRGHAAVWLDLARLEAARPGIVYPEDLDDPRVVIAVARGAPEADTLRALFPRAAVLDAPDAGPGELARYVRNGAAAGVCLGPLARAAATAARPAWAEGWYRLDLPDTGVSARVWLPEREPELLAAVNAALAALPEEPTLERLLETFRPAPPGKE